MFFNKQTLIGIYAGSSPSPDISTTFWVFSTPISGTSIAAFSATTDPSGTILVDWGDSTSNTINSSSLVNKTY